MTIIIKKNLPATTTNWQWPVQVGLPPQSVFVPATLQQQHWGKELSTISQIRYSKPVQRFNIILFNGLEDALQTYKRVTASRHTVKTDVILIKVKKKIFDDKGIQSQAETLSRTLSKASGASGVIFFANPKPDPQWFNDLLVELSHNHGIVTALNTLPDTDALCFVSPELEKATQLTTLIAKLSAGLMAGKLKFVKPVYYFLPDKRHVSTKEHKKLGIYLRDYIHQLDFSGESKTSTVVLNINRSVKKPVVKKVVPSVKKPITLSRNPGSGFKRATNLKGITVKSRHPPETLKKKEVPGTVKKPASAKPVSDKPIFESMSGDDTSKKATRKKSFAKPPLKKEDYKKSSAKPPASESAAEKTTAPEPRYLQAEINKTGSAGKITAFLIPDTKYDLTIFIGEKKTESIAAPEALDVAYAFEAPEVKEIIMDLLVYCNTEKEPMIGRLVLPREGDSDFASFPVFTGNELKTFEAVIYAYHKNRLLQKTVLRSDIRKATDQPVLKKMIMKNEAILEKDFSNIENRKPIDMSIVINEKKNDTLPAPGMAGNKPLGLIFNSAVETLTKKIKDSIEEVVTDESISNADLTDEANVTLLRRLATQGSLLFTLHVKRDLQGPLQIISNKEEYVPLEFVYSYPAPEAEAILCPNAKQALKEGACKNCFTKEADKHAHICPFGFWGLRQVIERHKYKTEDEKAATTDNSDYVVESKPTTGRPALPVLNRTQFAESDRVDNGNKGLTKKVDNVIIKNSAAAYKATSWKDWRSLVEKNKPDCFILIVHMEEDDRVSTESIEIGDKDLLPITRIQKDLINADGINRIPLVVLIGCETANLESYAFGAPDMLIASGTAIVLSNFTRIRGKHAGEIVMRLVELLKANAKKEIEFGSIVLKLKQQLLAEGLMVCLTLLAHGDAEWKIKS